MPEQTSRNFRINGDLTAEEDLTLDCTFDGSIQLAGHHLTIPAGSLVRAAVAAKTVTVHGRFEGQIEADVLNVATGADVNATVITKKFAVHEGALFSGAVNTERARAAAGVAKHRAGQRPGA